MRFGLWWDLWFIEGFSNDVWALTVRQLITTNFRHLAQFEDPSRDTEPACHAAERYRGFWLCGYFEIFTNGME